ncbi:unnamed protein product [Vitrella brassicaformis CCMP3155]|uniref:Uncharacterized protein n=1 Tax=Vitrella brassicaformis (strain CCMP3155) TaxID=1169540 RepID=A0A0G4EZD1_VITBC|nr:unnamed protein product [Vitrella brassicaformis CCMP3155]|eukprot:CEM04353.1 unnamed protein product [Vitrella brassicaformis CCMP3155]
MISGTLRQRRTALYRRYLRPSGAAKPPTEMSGAGDDEGGAASSDEASSSSSTRGSSHFRQHSVTHYRISHTTPRSDPRTVSMQPTRTPPASRPASPPLFQPADLLDIAISKAAEMAMSPDPNRRAALHSQISSSDPDDENTVLHEARRHVEKALGPLGLQDVLAFDIGDDLEAVLKFVYLIERGSDGEWRAVGRFLRLAFMYRLTPANATRPLRLSANALPTATVFYQMPLAMAIYKIIGQQLTYRGTRLALQQGNDGSYRIGNEAPLRVVPLGELPAGHPYTEGYKETDPVIRWGENWLFPSFSTFLLRLLAGRWCCQQGVDCMRVLSARVGRDDHRRGRLIAEGITEDLGIAVNWRNDRGNLNGDHVDEYRFVILCGFRRGETVAAYLWVTARHIELWTTERRASNLPSLVFRFPLSVPLWCRVLARFELETDVISRVRVLV